MRSLLSPKHYTALLTLLFLLAACTKGPVEPVVEWPEQWDQARTLAQAHYREPQLKTIIFSHHHQFPLSELKVSYDFIDMSGEFICINYRWRKVETIAPCGQDNMDVSLVTQAFTDEAISQIVVSPQDALTLISKQVGTVEHILGGLEALDSEKQRKYSTSNQIVWSILTSVRDSKEEAHDYYIVIDPYTGWILYQEVR